MKMISFVSVYIIIASSQICCYCQTIRFNNEPFNLTSKDDFLDKTSRNFDCISSNSTKSFHLNYTGLEKLNSGFIDNLPSITCLNLEGNKLEYIPSTIFENLPNLSFLNLAHNDIPVRNFEILGDHEKLHTLVLDGNWRANNYDKTLRFRIKRFPNLKKLFLRNCNIDSIDGIRYTFPNLTHLYLSDNSKEFGTLQKDINHIPTNLLHLEFQNNGICKFNGTGFVNLSSLFIDENQFTILGSGPTFLDVRKMTSLKVLTASRCKLWKIEENAFEGCGNLEKLDLSGNALQEIKRNTFRVLTRLKILSLAHNYFRNIPEIALKGLKKLFLNSNNIDKIEKGSLRNFTALEILDLNGNRIKTIDENTFGNLVNLRELDLEENLIQKLYVNWGQNLKILKNLNMDGNKISFVEDLFLEKTFVENVFLRNNYIENITIGHGRQNLVLYLNSFSFKKESPSGYRSRNVFEAKCPK